MTKRQRRFRGGSQSLLNMILNPDFRDGANKARATLATNIVNHITDQEEFNNILILGLRVFVLNVDTGDSYPFDHATPALFKINNDPTCRYYFFNDRKDADEARHLYIRFLRDNLY